MRLDWIFLPRENTCAKFYIIIIKIIIKIIIIIIIIIIKMALFINKMGEMLPTSIK